LVFVQEGAKCKTKIDEKISYSLSRLLMRLSYEELEAKFVANHKFLVKAQGDLGRSRESQRQIQKILDRTQGILQKTQGGLKEPQKALEHALET